MRAIDQQPPQYDRSYIAQPGAGAAAARAIRNSQIEAQKRVRRGGPVMRFDATASSTERKAGHARLPAAGFFFYGQ